MSDIFSLEGGAGALIKLSIILTIICSLSLILRRLDARWCVFLARAGLVLSLLITGIHLWAPHWRFSIDLIPASWFSVTPQHDFGEGGVIDKGMSAPGLFWVLIAVWIGGVLISLGRELIGFLSISNQGNRSSIASNRLQKLWDSVTRDYGVSDATIRVANTEQSPFIVNSSGGVLVVVPRTFESDDPDYIDHICHALRHEAAHICAKDYIWIPVMRITMCFLWFHPLVLWLVSDHLRACEEACDAEAARIGGVDQYRRSIAKLALDLVPVNQAISASLIRLPDVNDRLKRLTVSASLNPPQKTMLIPMILTLALLSTGIGLIQVMGKEASQYSISHATVIDSAMDNTPLEVKENRHRILDISDVKIEVVPKFYSSKEIPTDEREAMKSSYKSVGETLTLEDLGITQELIINAAKAELRAQKNNSADSQ